MQRLPEGKILNNILITTEEVNFYQLLSDGHTIEQAAELALVSKRTCEDRMYKLLAALELNTKIQLIAHLLRKKIIK